MTTTWRTIDRSTRNGYTFIELMIVVLILGIMAAVAAPKFGHALANAKVESAAKRIAADLRYARNEAQAKSTVRTAQFVVGDDRYSVVGMNDLDHRGQTHQVDLSDEGYDCQIISADFASRNFVSFDFYGRADEAGSVVIQCATLTRTIQVPASGSITVSP